MHYNHILRSFGEHADSLRPRMRQIDFRPGDVIGRADEPIKNILFPRSGLVSIVVGSEEGDRVEAAIIGCEGEVSGMAVFGAQVHANNSVAQTHGTAWSIATGDLIEIADHHAALRRALKDYELFLATQAQQKAVCNVRHSIRQRLAGWLLQARLASGEDLVETSQESIARLLGVQRATVSVVASQFQDAGLIKYRRARIQVADVPRLEREACGCYRALCDHHDRLLGSSKNP